MKPSIGRIVHYTLNQQDADEINKRRADFQAFRSNFSGPSAPGQAGADGHIAHIGNHAQEGDVCPAMIVRLFHPETTTANLQVFLDGNDTFWATSRTLDSGPSHWAWPERV
jgi:hypothetical protein